MADAGEFQQVLADGGGGNEVLRESDAKFRAVFETMIEACCIFEMIYDDLGRPVDWKILEANAGYEKQSGLKDVAGKLASEVMPGTEPYWIETFGRVVETGEAEQIERWHQPTGRWIHSSTARIGGSGSRRLVSVFYDITERKRAEIALRESEARLAADLAAAESLQALSGQLIQDTGSQFYEQIVGTAIAILGADFGSIQLMDQEQGELRLIASRNFSPEAENFWQRVSVATGSSCGAALSHGERVIIEDVTTDELTRTSDNMPYWKGSGIVAVQSTPLIGRDGKIIGMISTHWRNPHRPEPHELRLFDVLVRQAADFIERARAEAALRDSEERFQQFANASAAALWMRDAETLNMEFVSPAIATIYGTAPDTFLGDIRRWAAMIVPEDRDTAMNHVRQARHGEPGVHEFRIRRNDGSFRWIRDTGFPLYDETGNVVRVGGIAEDVTEMKLAVEHQGVLLAELQHRVRNIMGMIRSMANRSADGPASVEDYRSALVGRLLALARVQTLLTRNANAGESLRVVIENEIGALAHHHGQYELVGPDITVSPKIVEVLTLAFHELATNALKYGGLSVENGKVAVRWTTFDQRGTNWLILDWTEEGAPLRDPPTRRGFGSELIEGKIPYELRGNAKVTIQNAQARCHLEIPLTDGESILETDAPAPITIRGGSLDMTGAPDLKNRVILVVEDEYYMAADIASALRSAGADVLGPCPTEEMALALLDTTKPTYAVLDLNLGGGGARFEIAAVLRSQGIPFVFLTGYDAKVIPDNMRDVPRLQKPISMIQIVEAVSRL